MKEKTEEQQARLRKFMLVLPVIILFCAALIFVALGGGKGQPEKQAAGNQGINTSLPDAKFNKEQPQDKLSLYDQAARDSVKSHSDANNPLFSMGKLDTTGSHFAYAKSADASATKINQKLAEIGRELNKPETANKAVTNPAYGQNSPETDKLEKLLQSMRDKNADDPELKQLNGMLDKIMAIQNPAAAVQPAVKRDSMIKKDSTFKAIPAVIEGNQKVAQGGIVKLRLVDSIVLKNLTIPKGQLLFGSCNITNQRLLLDIKNIRLGTSIIPVELSVFSLDGLPGIDAPEAELAEAGGSGTANAVQSMEFLPMDESLTTQAASAGISAAKTLIGKKARKIKVKLHGGQRILLRNNQH